MTATPPLPRLSSVPSARRRILGVLALLVAVLALSVPLGLRALHGTSPSVAPASGVGVREVAPDASTANGSTGKDTTGQAGTDSGAKAPVAGNGTALGTGPAATATVVEPKIARSAWLGMKVRDLPGSAARARVIATGAGGQVTSENVVTATDPTGGQSGAGSPARPSSPGSPGSPGSPTGSGVGDPRAESGASLPTVGVNEARMVLSVPAKTLDGVLTQLSTIGTVSYRSSQSQDVTDSYIDTKARIEPMRDGIDRVRALLAKTTDLQQVITLESELTRRQAELDSLTQRLAQLDAMTTMSDVTVSLWTDATTPVQTDDGIGGGLRTAWESLLGSVTVILTGLAALLPWLVLLVPLTLLALRLWRRRSTGVSSATSPAAFPAAGPSATVPARQPAGAPATTSASAPSAAQSPGASASPPRD